LENFQWIYRRIQKQGTGCSEILAKLPPNESASKLILAQT